MDSAVLAPTHPSDVKPTIARAMAPTTAPNIPSLIHCGIIISSCLEKRKSLFFFMKNISLLNNSSVARSGIKTHAITLKHTRGKIFHYSLFLTRPVFEVGNSRPKRDGQTCTFARR
jgi:hypothetical protein